MTSATRSRRGPGGLGNIAKAAGVALMLLAWPMSLVGQERVAPEQIEPYTCLEADCHDAMTTAPVVHAPVKDNECDVCHEADDEEVHEFAFPDTSAEMCYGCHKSVTKKEFVHAPVEADELPCTTSCHSPHSGADKAMLKAETSTEMCLDCHDTFEPADMYHQSPEADGCSSCHDSHSSDSAKFLRAEPPELCNSCHTDMAEAVEANAVVHGPVALGCDSCHDPHNALAGKGLEVTGPELCTSCHADFAETLSAMADRHPLLLEDKGCQGCHDPHASENKMVLLDSPRQLCLTCHAESIEATDGRMIEDLSILAEVDEDDDTEILLHGPLVSGTCAGCHEPHGSEAPRFLRKTYPDTFYSEYDLDAYDLCFSCHESKLATEASTASATKFRDGEQNLHFVHVNQDRKGRKCGTCHPAHFSTGPNFVRETVPFGTWDLPIGLTKTETGGSCATGCHQNFAYDRDKLPPAESSDQPTPPAEDDTEVPGAAPAQPEDPSAPPSDSAAPEVEQPEPTSDE